jgi:hypothetical protein
MTSAPIGGGVKSTVDAWRQRGEGDTHRYGRPQPISKAEDWMHASEVLDCQTVRLTAAVFIVCVQLPPPV